MSPEPGHILPTLKIARDLQMRGHSVIYHTCLALHQQLRNLGFECHPLLEPTDEALSPNGLFSTTQSSKNWYQALVTRFNNDRVLAYSAISDDITAAAIATDADLVLIDSLMNYLYGIKVDCSIKPEISVGFIQTNLPFIIFGKNMARSPRLLQRADRTIILCPKEFEIDDFKIESGCYAEASIYLDRSETYFPWEWLVPNRQLIYCSFGSQCSLYTEAIDLFRSLLAVAKRMPDYQFIISAGPYFHDLDAIIASFPNCKAFANIPQTSLLARAAAMISQGGLGSIKECLYFGVPMLVIPFVNDQPLNAARVRHHGLGISLSPGNVTVEGLHSEINRLLKDREISSRVKRMREIFQAREKGQFGVTMCEEILVHRRARSL